MYEDLVTVLRDVANTNLSNTPLVRFKRRLLVSLKRSEKTFELVTHSTLEAIVASMTVELPLSLDDERVNELADLYFQIVCGLYDATVAVGYSNLDAAFRLQCSTMSLRLSG
jgi:hypothetical protein